MAIKNAALYEESVQRNAELRTLLAVSEAVASSLQLDAALDRSLQAIIETTDVDVAEVWIAESNAVALRCHGGDGPEAMLGRTRYEAGAGLPGTVLVSGQAIFSPDLDTENGVESGELRRAGFCSFAALPVRYRGETLGVLCVGTRRSGGFQTADALRLLEGVAEQMAPALENANLQAALQDAAIIEERQRISREMHDGLGQVLGYVNTQVLAIRKLTEDGRHDRAAAELERLETAARGVYEEVREGILALRASPDEAGAIDTLRDYVRSYRELFGVEVELMVMPEAAAAQLAPSAEIQLIRIVQEALHNVRRHAGVARVQARFSCQGSDLAIEIVDDGCGFDPERLPSGRRPRFGLQTMRERAEGVGGTFSVQSAVGSGTRVSVSLPTVAA
jgi:signal transduction histidine kinase